MSKFCRIIELADDEQMLLVKSYNEEESMPCLVLTTDFDGATAEYKMSFKTYKALNKAFDNFTLESAKTIRKSSAEMIG